MKEYKQKNKKGTYSDHWATPKDIYEQYMTCGFVDPCPLNCEVDNLNKDFGPVDLFINPPYSDINSWVKFGLQHKAKYPKSIIVYLVPARTDTIWFHELLDNHSKVTFIKGRLKFNDSKTGAPFPSIFISLGAE